MAHSELQIVINKQGLPDVHTIAVYLPPLLYTYNETIKFRS